MPPELEAYPAQRLPRIAKNALAILIAFVAVLIAFGSFLSTTPGRRFTRYVKLELIPTLFPQEIPAVALHALETAESLQTYILNGNPETNAIGEFNDEVGLHAHKVLGEKTIEKPEELDRLMAAIKEGIYKPGMPAACFSPRHGISVSSGNDTIDFLICFECGRIYIYKRGERLPLAGLTYNHGKEEIVDLFPSAPAEETAS